MKESANPLFIAIAEDDPQTRLSLDVTLRRAGHQTLLAESGDVLLEMIGNMSEEEVAEIDLLVTDINMPGTQGGQLVRELDSRALVLPVVVITAYGKESLESEFSQRGSIIFLRKPFLPKALTKSVSMAYSIACLARNQRVDVQ